MILPPFSIITRSKLRNVASRWAIAITVPSAHQAPERFADRLLGFAVERRRRLVEQQDRRILQKGARDCDALALAARKLDAAVADHGSEPFRQSLDEIAARRNGRAQHLIVGRGRPAVTDVFHDRSMEQRDVLRHDRNRLAQALLGDPGNILAVDGDAPCCAS